MYIVFSQRYQLFMQYAIFICNIHGTLTKLPDKIHGWMISGDHDLMASGKWVKQ